MSRERHECAIPVTPTPAMIDEALRVYRRGHEPISRHCGDDCTACDRGMRAILFAANAYAARAYRRRRAADKARKAGA